MFAGYNTNISHKDKIYHIQTEDSGQDNPVIVTLLYSEGAILASKKTGYDHLIENSDFEQKIRTIMKEQHEHMINELLAGKYAAENR
jgi:hypothetical protein